ncbi:MAG: hypothetical protein WC112_06240 [Proteiniphilum sp.]
MKNFRKKGAILVSLLLYLYAGMTMIFSFLAISCRYSASASWETRLLRRENAALQGEAIVRNWFRNSAECGEIAAPSEYTPDEGPLDDPYLEIPDGILSVLNYYEKGVTVEAELIDQNYSDSFLPEAERLEIPRGAPSGLMLSKDGSDPDICVARRYFIRIKVFDRTREDPQLVLAESVIVVCGSAGDLHALTLCTNKQ